MFLLKLMSPFAVNAKKYSWSGLLNKRKQAEQLFLVIMKSGTCLVLN